MQRIKKFWETYGPEIRWLISDSLCLTALVLFLATLGIWAGLWTRTF